LGTVKTHQHDGTDSLAPSITVCGGGEGLGASIGRERARLAERYHQFAGEDQVGPADDGIAAFATTQALAGEMQSHQRGGAGGVHAERRAGKAHHIGNAPRREAMPAARAIIGIDRTLVGLTEPPVAIFGRHDPDEHADRQAIGAAHGDAGALHRLPRCFEE
jgi:hypothetical protein